MKRFLAACLAVLICVTQMVVISYVRAEAGGILVRFLMTSDMTNQSFNIKQGAAATPVNPIGNDNGLTYYYKLDEGVLYTFNGFRATGTTFSVEFRPAAGVDFWVDISSGTLTPYVSQPSPSPSPSQNTGGSSSARDTVKTSDANALVLADIGAPSPRGDPGEMVMFTLALAVNREYLPSEQYLLRNITIEPAIPTSKKDIGDWPFDIENASYIRRLDDMGFYGRADVTFEFRISEAVQKGTYPVPFRLSATVWRSDPINGTTITEDVAFMLTQYVKVLRDGADSGKANKLGAIDIAARDASGKAIAAPKCGSGERVRLRLPLVSRSNLTDVTITPVFSSDIDKCAVVAESVNYGKTLPNMKKGETITLEYDFKVSPLVTKGNKPIEFKARYFDNGAEGECTVTAYIDVVNGYDKGQNCALGLIVQSYDLSADGERMKKLFAGEPARLTLHIYNSGGTGAVRLRVRAMTDGRRLLLDTGQSDTQYVSAIAQGDSADVSFGLIVPRDAASGAAAVTVELSCETDSGAWVKTEQTLQIPLRQRVKAALGTPEAGSAQEPLQKDEPIPLRCRIVNLGRAKIYSVRLGVRGQGLSVYEAYYGGDVAPLSDLFATFKVVSASAGALNGKVVLTFEDEDGETYEQTAEIALTVEERGAAPRRAELGGGQTGETPRTPVAGIAGAALLALGLAALVYTRLKNGRKKSFLRYKGGS